MKSFIKILQNPFVKLFLAPMALMLFGSVLGARQVGQFHIKTFLLLYMIVAILEVINHFLRIRLDQKMSEEAPNFILIACEVILLILYVIFALSQHWIINVLVLLAIAYNHLIYFPSKFTTSIYHLVLNVFFNGFIWQVIAYFSQSSALHADFLLKVIPITMAFLALELESNQLKIRQMPDRRNPQFPFNKYISAGLALLAIGLASYDSLPSHSFFLVQIVFVMLSLLVFAPLLVESTQQHQVQNKLNYLASIFLIFNIGYTLSYIF